uniref:Uncharacterized protein n=1 Tax=Euplotes harpa TaxID=151035 RepID=A0A7S3NBS7_9SPIT|mmetsp:Transcript_33924/g.39179  ORF Transcript_33924/g.39179 Transcript_33924/m.39179 type:complete len:157 (+) Transcript_33924:226-696(+)|eukprot:CAMPEP_0168343784 /NCGR_PEP_ID=MMETSP0213-20121227/16357_1 /TAXON_ID=151035 /ORGANISM="Euplotes harpa, Strain FSP1.4" /LENGTH=156 /DNA_ID=CAMNT_0008351261 /DNA_START=251 /DNA_END=721 /DNA_ORIENTATION=+
MMKRYIERDVSDFSFAHRKGKLELYKGQKFKRMKEESCDNNVVSTSFNHEAKFDPSQQSIDVEKGNNTKRTLVGVQELPKLIFEESKKPIRHITPSPPATKEENPFDNLEFNGIYYEDFRPNSLVKNTNIYSNGNDLSINKNKSTRASTIIRTLPL